MLDEPFWGARERHGVYLRLTGVAFGIRGIEPVAIGHPVPNGNSRRSIENYVQAANGQYDGDVRDNEWCRDELVDSRRYSVSKRDFRSEGQ